MKSINHSYRLLLSAGVALLAACTDLEEPIQPQPVEEQTTETVVQETTEPSATKAIEYKNVITLELTEHGQLKELIGDNLTTADKLILSGPIDATDVEVFRNQMTALLAIDLTEVTFVESDATYVYNSYQGYTAKLEEGIISENMFSGKSNFVEIKLPKNIEALEEGSFYNCSSLQSITLPETLTSLGERSTFASCSSLTSMAIPEGITWIPESAFSNCGSLATISLPGSLVGISEGAFYGCSSLSSISFPEGLKEIGYNAFYECSSLKEVILPDNLEVLGSNAFNKCVNLENLYLPAAFAWGTYRAGSTFADCTNLKQVTLAEGLTTIGERTFYGCTNLTSITLPKSLVAIGGSAFQSTGLTEVELPDGVTSIGESAFIGCASLAKVKFPANLKEIGGWAFANCSVLNGVELPEGLHTIGASAFEDCNALTAIDFLPNSLKNLGNRAFWCCENVTSAIIPDSVEVIPWATFSGCSNLSSVILPKYLKEIGGSAFSQVAIQSIDLPDGLRVIGESAFWRCSSLGEINLPNSVTTIGYEAFAYDSNLTLASPYLPESLTTIGDGAFSSTAIKDKVLYFSSSLESIGDYVFGNNSTIGAIYLEGSNDVAIGDLFDKPSNVLIYASGNVTLPSNENVYNVIRNGTCLKLRMREGTPWHCPEAFKAGKVTLVKQFNGSDYSIYYATSGRASNWYAINMPFTPTEITSEDGRTWAPFNADVAEAKPFWLRKLTVNGFENVTSMEADVPYIISFPNNKNYAEKYNVWGDITFTATNVTIDKTQEGTVQEGPYYSMYGNYSLKAKDGSTYVLNSPRSYSGSSIKIDGVQGDCDYWGNSFIHSLRDCWVWEPYISTSAPTTRTISLDNTLTRGYKPVGSVPAIDDM